MLPYALMSLCNADPPPSIYPSWWFSLLYKYCTCLRYLGTDRPTDTWVLLKLRTLNQSKVLWARTHPGSSHNPLRHAKVVLPCFPGHDLLYHFLDPLLGLRQGHEMPYHVALAARALVHQGLHVLFCWQSELGVGVGSVVPLVQEPQRA